MKMLVVSDTHGMTKHVRRVLDEQTDITHLMHLGDGANDILQLERDYPHLIVYSVKGNNDYFSKSPDRIVTTFLDYVIFATHGHLHGVRQSVYGLLNNAREHNANLVLFGHTHIKFDQTVDGIRFLNPSAYGGIIIDQNGIKFV